MRKSVKAKIASAALAAALTMGATTGAFAAITPNTFNDVKPSDWYYGAVDHVVSHGYFNGVGANVFSPNSNMSRAMAVTVLARMFAGSLDSYSGQTIFEDVPADAYYAKAVQWAVDKGITNGTSATTFSPDGRATREQISVFLYNAVKVYGSLGNFNSAALNGFADRDQVSSWSETALQWATANEVINGNAGRVLPQNSATRAEFATIAMNFDNNYESHSRSEVDTKQRQRDWLDVQATKSVSMSNMEKQVLDLTNKERVKNGLPPLKAAAEMQEAALIRANELAVRANGDHKRPNGLMFYTVLHDINSTLAYKINGTTPVVCGDTGENFAWGYTDAAETVSSWMNSSGHRKNILDPDFTHVGISVTPRYENGRPAGYYWEQFFLGVNPG